MVLLVRGKSRGFSRGVDHAIVTALAALVAFAPVCASAEEREQLLDLEWLAPAECPSGDDVLARVSDLVGHGQSPGRRRISARGSVTTSAVATQSRYLLELVVVGSEANRRTISGEDCGHLVDAAALILALDIDPDALTRRDGAPAASGVGDRASPTGTPGMGAPTGGDKALPQLHRPEPVARPAPDEDRRALHLHGGARIILDEGSLPRLALGAGAVGTLARGPLVFEVQGTLYNEQFTVAGPRGGRGGAYVGLSTLGGSACWRGLALGVDWRGCVGGEIGIESTSGVSVTRPETASGLWSAASAMFSARVLPRRILSPTAGVALVHPIGAPPVFIEGFGTVFEPPPVVVRGFLGLDMTFF